MNKRIRTHFLAFLVLTFLSFTEARAQVTATIGDISGAMSDIVSVPVTLIGIESTSGFNSFAFTVNLDNTAGNIGYLGHDLTASTTVDFWGFVRSRANNTDNPETLQVGGFVSSSTPTTVSGVMIYLRFEILGTSGGGSVSLDNFRVSQSGVPLIDPPPVLVSQLVVANAPVARDDAYDVDEGALLSRDAASGVLANDDDADNDPLTVSLDVGPVNGVLLLAADGSFTYEHDGSETTSDTFTYIVSDGSATDTGTVNITIAPVNDPPVFTSVMGDQAVNQGATVSGLFTASDAEDSTLTFSLVSGPAEATVGSSSGAFSWVASSAGSFSVVVSVSDGTATVNAASFAIVVRVVERYETLLSGLNEPSPVVSGGTGSALIEFIPEDNELQLSGSFASLGSAFAVGELGVGVNAVTGTFVRGLTVVLNLGDQTSGLLPVASNTMDLDTVSFPSGMDKEMFIQALRDGNVFLNIRSLDALTGEIRGHFRLTTNTAPTPVDVMGPLIVDVTGNPSDVLFDLSWSGGPVDADGDETRLILGAYADAGFATLLSASDVSVTSTGSVNVLVSEAAQLFDTITGGTPGNINLGGTATVYYRLVSSDGTALSGGASASVDLVRGSIVSTEQDVVPQEFVLRGNYPNPFNPFTTIQFDLPEAADVQIDVLDLLGRTMISVPSQTFSAGIKVSVRIDASALASGIYMYRVLVRTASETHVSTGTMTLIK